MSWLPGWNCRRKVTISASQVDSTLIDFPLNLQLARTDVVGAMASGNDIRFTAIDGLTLLDHVWTGFTDDNCSGAYVKVPSIDASSDTVIYMYYGNPSVSDRDAAEAVGATAPPEQHAGAEAPNSPSVSDASNPTSVFADYVIFWTGDNWYDGQPDLTGNVTVSSYAGSPTAVAGGVQLNASDMLSLGTRGNFHTLLHGSPGLSQSLTLQNWQDDDTHVTENHFVSGQYGNHVMNAITYRTNIEAARWEWQMDPAASTPGYYVNGNMSLSNSDTFRRAVSFEMDGTDGTGSLFNNGTLLGSEIKSDVATTLQFSEAARSDAGMVTVGWGADYGFVGIVRDVRVMKKPTSAAWLKFEYANLMNVGGTVTLSEEESLPTVAGPYQAIAEDVFQTDVQQAETYIPGITAGHTYGS